MDRGIYTILTCMVVIFAMLIVIGVNMQEKGWIRHWAVKFGMKAPTSGDADRTWVTGSINVNLPGGNEESGSRVNIKMETADSKVYKELEMLKPKIQDGIIDIVSSKSYTEISGEGSKQKMAKEIEDTVNSYLKTGKIHGVVFREYYFSPAAVAK